MINFYLTTVIHLSLEEIHNQGITPEETKQAIESIVNPFQTFMYSTANTLKCKPQGINHNWDVEVNTIDYDNIDYVITLIENKLFNLLKEKRKKKKKRIVK